MLKGVVTNRLRDSGIEVSVTVKREMLALLLG